MTEPHAPDRQFVDDLARALAPCLIALVRQQVEAATETLPLPILNGVQQAALDAAPRAQEKPISVKRLAHLAGYKLSGYFREGVRMLVDQGHLVRIRGGVRRSRQQSIPASLPIGQA